MDQVKEQWRKIQPHVFWIMCGGILALCLGSWYMSTSTLKAEQEANKTKIEGTFSTVGGLQSKAATHPNASTNAKMDELNRDYGNRVAAGWEQQYRRQEGILVWPASFDEDFQTAVKPLKPIEKVPVNTPFGLAIRDDFRRRYRDFIDYELPHLAETIGARWQARRDGSSTQDGQPPMAGPGGAMVGPGGAMGPLAFRPDGTPIDQVDRSIVLWAPANQQELLMTHYGFTMKEDDPSTLDVLYAQEDLWVLQNLMDIIKRANEGATARHEATVKSIEFIRIGRTALGNAGQVMVVGATTGSGGPSSPILGGPVSEGGGVPAEGGMPGGEGGMPGESTSPTADPKFNGLDPANWRYVDQKNIPLAGFQLRDAIMAPTEQNALLTVAKRMPVRVRFEIDQRRMNRLLAEFGNAQLPVEIRQVRINRDAAAVGTAESFFNATGGGGGMGGPGGGLGPPPGYGGEGGGFGGYSAAIGEGYGGPGGGMGVLGAGNLTRDATVDSNLIKIEIYGILYLYNPVNRSVLGLEPVGMPTATPAEASPEAPATPTAMASPAPATPAGG